MMGCVAISVEIMTNAMSRMFFISQSFSCAIPCRDDPIEDEFMFNGLGRVFCIQFFCRRLNIGNIWYSRVAFFSSRCLP